MAAVLLDAGGVLIMPSPGRARAALGVDVEDAVLDQAHYRATAATDAHPPRERMRYMRTFVETCGFPPEEREAAAARLYEVYDGANFILRSPLAGAEALDALTALPVAFGVVSNAVGTVARHLREAKVCQVGPGPGLPVEFVIDSALVGVEKPDPAIFELAFARLGIGAERSVYVGDTARIDVDGAHAAGMRALHLDPYGDCPDPPGHHEHVRSLADLARWVGDHVA